MHEPIWSWDPDRKTYELAASAATKLNRKQRRHIRSLVRRAKRKLQRAAKRKQTQ